MNPMTESNPLDLQGFFFLMTVLVVCLSPLYLLWNYKPKNKASK
jgi:hypothetical protein